jgi:ABC-type nitrate/sulfonate/bicarbonate transport system substrate-binding protein
MSKLKLALDWTANTNHTGFYIAQVKGFYQENKIDIEIQTPEADNYQVTPAKKIELNIADFALCPMESIVSFRTKVKPFPLTAIGTIFQDDLSRICVPKSSGLERPADLDNTIYASYKARYEDHIVRSMIKNDGGNGDIEVIYPEKLGIWNTLLENKAHSTWIFDNWEGVMARMQGVELNYFKMEDFDIPYGYSPIIACSESCIARNPNRLRAFMEASRKGFLYAKNNPEEAAEILLQHLPKHERERAMVRASQHIANAHYGDENTWGVMDMNKIQNFYDWLHREGLEATLLYAEETATNTLLSPALSDSYRL